MSGAFFFFSSRRRHTRWTGDWSSDVCSSDLTGRLSAKNPAVQTIPKRTRWAKRLRECIIAPEGHVIWQRDFSQGELRIAACEANEPTMIDAYLNNKDLHGITGAKFAAMLVQEFLAMQHAPEGSEAEACYAKYRQRGKNANFGMIYKISAGGFQVYCRRNGLNLTQEECEDYLKAFFALYGGLHPWHQKQ